MTDKFMFVQPPEAPVFRPTDEEFKNPLDYLMKIRHIGTKTGICKIIPPKSWKPPFAVNMREFTFTPRIQRLYELENQKFETIDFSSNKELRNLQFYGAGPKAAVPLSAQGKNETSNKEPVPVNVSFLVDGVLTFEKVEDFRCRTCERGDDEANLLVCDTPSCQACYHTHCLKPQLRAIPKYAWICPECIRGICLKPPDPFGFPQSNKTYALHEFGVMADNFKSKYFGQPCTDVSCAMVEREFWRILQEYNDDVVVEYGADIHSSTQGSGFPTLARLSSLVGTAQQLEDAKMYALNPWNLNILPLLDRSVLRFIKGNIDGMKVPWCYVGMVFSSFCWHIEDHWSYSINFNHWGEPKTWYGVSRLHAEDFERAMRKHTPELFDEAPDLLHHITTNMNPNILQAEGVPIYRTDQYCGEFVVTFPRAYHSGFNQGFNFAEAVNICLPDWLPIGRECIDHYAQMKRHCVFSNDELLCTLAEVAVGRCNPEEVIRITTPFTVIGGDKKVDMKKLSNSTTDYLPGCSIAGLDISSVAVVHQEFASLLAHERHMREVITQQLGVHMKEQIRFDELPDDARVCDSCLTTLFLSAVSCPCGVSAETVNPTSATGQKRKADSDDTLEEKNEAPIEDSKQILHHTVCLSHCEKLCSKCPPSTWTLKYHFTIEELEDLEHLLATRLKSFYCWKEPLNRILKGPTSPQSTPSGESSDTTLPMKTDPDGSPVSDATERAVESGSWSLAEFRDQIRNGRTAGYHTDDLFTEAETILHEVDKILQICASVRKAVCSKPSTTADSTDMVRFQLRKQAVFTSAASAATSTAPIDQSKPTSSVTFVSLQHEMDANNPRDFDLARLLDACKQQNHPIRLTNEPDVQLISLLISRLTEWRQTARDTVSTVCQLSLTNATRSLVAHCSSPTPNGASDTLSNDERSFRLLTSTLQQLESEFPGFVSHVPEWVSLELLCRAFKWLCIHQRQLDEKRHHQQTLPCLRQYAIMGEALLGQLNASSTLPVLANSRLQLALNKQPNSRSTGTPTAFDTSIAPLSRLLRARMHTSMGQLSQLIGQVESVVSILCEALSVTGDFSCAEVLMVLQQLRSMQVNHLLSWEGPRNQENENAGPQSSLDDFLNPEFGLDTSQTPSEVVLHLREVVTERSHLLVEKTKCAPSPPLLDRPSLTEAETLLILGNLLDCSVTLGRSADSSRLAADIGRAFSLQLDELRHLVAETRSLTGQLHRILFPNATTTEDKVDDIQLIKRLLPVFPSEVEDSDCFNEFMTAFTHFPHQIGTVYSDEVRKCRKSIQLVVRNVTETASLCSACSARLLTCPIPSKPVQQPCPLCRLVGSGRHDTLIHLCPTTSSLELGPSGDGDMNGTEENIAPTFPLSFPTAFALEGYLKSVTDWQNDLVSLIKSNSTTLGCIWSNLKADLVATLPTDVHPPTGMIAAAEAEQALTTNDPLSLNASETLTDELRCHLCIGLTLSNKTLEKPIAFLAHLIGVLSSSTSSTITTAEAATPVV